MKDFCPTLSAKEITAAIDGKVVKSVSVYDNHGDDYFEIRFIDGSSFKFRYDWIYEWEVSNEKSSG